MSPLATPPSQRYYSLVPAHPTIDGYITLSEPLAYDHTRRGGAVEVDWAPADKYAETEANVETAREWSLHEYPERT